MPVIALRGILWNIHPFNISKSWPNKKKIRPINKEQKQSCLWDKESVERNISSKINKQLNGSDQSRLLVCVYDQISLLFHLFGYIWGEMSLIPSNGRIKQTKKNSHTSITHTENSVFGSILVLYFGDRMNSQTREPNSIG